MSPATASRASSSTDALATGAPKEMDDVRRAAREKSRAARSRREHSTATRSVFRDRSRDRFFRYASADMPTGAAIRYAVASDLFTPVSRKALAMTCRLFARCAAVLAVALAVFAAGANEPPRNAQL